MDPLARRILSTFDNLQRDRLDLHALFELAGGNPPEERAAVLDMVSTLVRSGLLRDEGGDFYSRTEDGRLAVLPSRDVTLYMREGCHLCDEAKSIIAPVLAAFGARLWEIDIDDDPALLARYTNDVPVVFVGDHFFAQHRIDPAQLRQRLQRAVAAS